MKRLESSANPRIKRIRRFLAGRDRTIFLVEGRKSFQEAVASGVAFLEILVTEEIWKTERKQLMALEKQGTEVFLITRRLARAISGVESPPGIVGIIARPEPGPILYPLHYGAFLISIRDPGNFGTMIRAAEATGCEFLSYTPDCVDPYSPKVVRASMGSIFRVPLIEASDTTGYLREMKRTGVHTYGLVPRNGHNLFLISPSFPALLVIGSEHKGLPKGLSLEETITIPMAGRVQSLNVAMAATICFYWLSPSNLTR
jgi:TrmH family RNA methyltransferase